MCVTLLCFKKVGTVCRRCYRWKLLNAQICHNYTSFPSVQPPTINENQTRTDVQAHHFQAGAEFWKTDELSNLKFDFSPKLCSRTVLSFLLRIEFERQITKNSSASFWWPIDSE